MAQCQIALGLRRKRVTTLVCFALSGQPNDLPEEVGRVRVVSGFVS